MATIADFDNLMQHVYHVHGQWKLFQCLYMHSDERSTLFAETIPGTFQGIKIALVQDVVVTICRLTDPAQTLNHSNLVLAQFLDDPKISKEIQAQAEHLTKLVKSLRDARNAMLAHLDLDHSRNPVPAPMMKTIGDAVKLLCEVAQSVGVKLDGAYRGIDNYTIAGEVNQMEAVLMWGESHPRERHEILRTIRARPVQT